MWANVRSHRKRTLKRSKSGKPDRLLSARSSHSIIIRTRRIEARDDRKMVAHGLKEGLVISNHASHINYFCSANLLCCLIRIENNQVIVKIKGPLTAAVQR